MREYLALAVSFVLQSRTRLWSTVAAATLSFGAFEFAVSRWIISVKIDPFLHAMLQAGIVGLGAGAALFLTLLGLLERRRILENELGRLAELNHTIRNSLEVIVLAHYGEEDDEHRSMVLECTRRIDEKLRELFPTAGGCGSRKKKK
jgi:hypothetical protein